MSESSDFKCVQLVMSTLHVGSGRSRNGFAFGRLPVSSMCLPAGEDLVRLIPLFSKESVETGDQLGLDLEAWRTIGALDPFDGAFADPGRRRKRRHPNSFPLSNLE